MQASRWGHDSIVSVLLESKAEIDAVEITGVRFAFRFFINLLLTY